MVETMSRSWSAVPGRELNTRWAEFDPDWYLRAYPMARAASDPLEFYSTRGVELGHSPNIFFDEIWYLDNHPEVAQAVAEGKFASGFDHYCQVGLHQLSPHWLFDIGHYRQACADISEAGLGTYVNLYDHYLEVGSKEGRIGHPLFSPDVYREHLVVRATDDDVANLGPFAHFLRSLDRGEKAVTTSIYFDNEWYLLNYPDVGKEIADRKYKCALHHYLCNGQPRDFDPLCDFSEKYYVEQNPDVSDAIERRWFRNGYMHFVRFGAAELRDPAPHIALRYYWLHQAVERSGADPKDVSGAFAHLLTIGLAKGLPLRPPSPPLEIPEDQTRALFLARAENLLPQRARQPLDFELDGPPDLSVIVVVHNQLAMTLMSLASLRDNYAGNIELVLVDSGSSDDARHIESYVRGATILRFDTNIGFVHGCNAALGHVRAELVLFLNNDIQLAPGSVAAAIRRLESEPRIAAVGGKIIRTNEKLQEAGCIVWRDGRTVGYLRDQSPLVPEANFVRDVDFCSAVFLMTRKFLLQDLGGFDVAFAPAYFEDTDLCMRFRKAGYRVVYDPNVVVHHYEYGSARHPRASITLMLRNHKIFFEKHFDLLRTRPAASPDAHPVARFADSSNRRILYLEDTVPLRSLGSGYVRSNDIIRVMAEMGYRVTVYPIHGCSFHPGLLYGDFPDDVEIIHDRNHHDLAQFLKSRPGYYDGIWICRTHNLPLVKPVLEQATIVPPSTVIVLDTEAVAATRDALHAEIENRPFDLDRAITLEFEHAYFCQKIVTVNELEAQVLKRRGYADTKVVGTLREVSLTSRNWQDRSGLLFVGALHDRKSPNYDSLCWFVDEVLPLVEKELGWETRLTIVGYRKGSVALDRFASHPRVTLGGFADDLAPVYDTHRLMVAPTRFASGTPYKVYEAASYGLPVVATELLREQLGWTHGRDILAASAADPADFAAHILDLYRSEDLWGSLRDAAAERLRTENSRLRYSEMLGRVLPRADQLNKGPHAWSGATL